MKRFLAFIPMLLVLSGCSGGGESRGVELNRNAGQLLPVSALAIDTHEKGYMMTVESIQQDSLDGEASPIYFTVEGQSFDALFKQADQMLSSRLYLSHAQVILVSPQIAANSLTPLVDCLLARPDARLTLRIVVARGAVPDYVLRSESIGDGIPGVALAAMLSQRASEEAIADCPLFRLTDRQETGDVFSLPVLRLRDDGHASPDGSAEISDGMLTYSTGGERHA